jgi:hypothetical protein
LINLFGCKEITAARRAGTSIRVFSSNVITSGLTGLVDWLSGFIGDLISASNRFDWGIWKSTCPAALTKIITGKQMNVTGTITSQTSNPEINQNKLEYTVSESFCIALAIPYTGCHSANFLKNR